MIVLSVRMKPHKMVLTTIVRHGDRGVYLRPNRSGYPLPSARTASADITNSGIPVKVGTALTAHETVAMFMRN